MSWAGPEFDGHQCSLGYSVAAWIEQYCCHGPGDLQGEPVVLDNEWLQFLVEAYRIDPITGGRVYDEAVLSRPKGRAKSELAGFLAIAEAFGEVRFDGWDAAGQPVGRPVTSPLLKCLATEEGQAGNTFEVAAYIAADWGRTEHPDIYGGVTGVRVYQSATAIYLAHGGEIRACSAGAASKDGGRETFVVCDEALALDTPLPTPTGWTTMGDVAVGDRLIGSDGLPTEVLKTTAVTDDRTCWRVTFSDRTSMVASDGHLWLARASESPVPAEVRTTGQMAATGLRYRVPRPQGLKAPEIPLPIDPYVLGLWLGDGDRTNAVISVSNDDAAAEADQIERRGYTVRHCQRDRGQVLYVSLPGSSRGRFSPVKGLKVRLREQGLLGNKHVPTMYLRAGAEQRAELLRGLMDSDGHVTERGGCGFVQNTRGLVDDIVELLRSLGQDAYVTWRADDRSSTGGTYKVCFTPTNGLVPFALPRKVARVRPGVRDAHWTTISSIEPVASVPVRCVAVDAPDHLFMAGDGWKLTHNSHLYASRELKSMYATVRRNLGKRKIAQPWMLQTTTAYRPGEQSIAEATMTSWRKRELPAAVLVDHREAKGRIDLDDAAHTLAQLRSVYGAATEWMDLDRIYRDMRDPRVCPDDATAARYYLNRSLSTRDAWIPLHVMERQAKRETVAPKTAVALGFDGSLSDDATVLIGSRMSDGFLFPVGIWAKPSGPEGAWWEVPRGDVLAAIDEAFERYDVVRLYADPHEWRSDLEAMVDRHGKDKVVSWATSRDTAMAAALDRMHADLVNGAVYHDGDPVVLEHFGNAYVRRKGGHRLVRKEHDQSPRKIDALVGAALAYEARADAMAAGWGSPKSRRVLVLR